METTIRLGKTGLKVTMERDLLEDFAAVTSGVLFSVLGKLAEDPSMWSPAVLYLIRRFTWIGAAVIAQEFAEAHPKGCDCMGTGGRFAGGCVPRWAWIDRLIREEIAELVDDANEVLTDPEERRACVEAAKKAFLSLSRLADLMNEEPEGSA